MCKKNVKKTKGLRATSLFEVGRMTTLIVDILCLCTVILQLNHFLNQHTLGFFRFRNMMNQS